MRRTIKPTIPFENSEGFLGFYSPNNLSTPNSFSRASFEREKIRRLDVGYILVLGFAQQLFENH